MKKRLGASLLALSFGLSSGGAQAQIRIESTIEQKEDVVHRIESLAAFQREFHPLGGARDVLFQGNARAGLRIADPQANIQMTTRRGELTIRRINHGELGAVHYIATLRDSSSGEGLTILPGDLSVLDENSGPLSFSVRSFDASGLRASVIVLVDRSESMEPVMGEVVKATNALLDSLPDTMRCQVVPFAKETDWPDNDEGPCTAANAGLASVEAAGPTYLYEALEEAYRTLHIRADDHQTFVIVLTDGQPSSHERAEAAAALKGDIQTVFIWLGEKADNAEQVFKPFADTYVSDPQGAVRYLDAYFSVFADAIDKQALITVDKGE